MLVLTVGLDKIEPFEAPGPTAGFVESMRRFGQVEPIVLARNGDGYRVVAGRRRIVAARKIGKTSIEARILEGGEPDKEAGLLLLENLQRSYNPASEALALAVLIKCGHRAEELAELFGISRAKVSQRLKLLLLTPDLFAKVERGEMSARAGWVAADLPDDVQRELATSDKKITIGQVEALRRARNLKLLDLDSIEVPRSGEDTMSELAREDLAARVSAEAMRRIGSERQILLEAAAVLNNQGHVNGEVSVVLPPLSSYIREQDLIVRREDTDESGMEHKAVRIQGVLDGAVQTPAGRVSFAALDERYRLVLSEETVAVGDVLLQPYAKEGSKTWRVTLTTPANAVMAHDGEIDEADWSEIDKTYRMLERSDPPPLPEKPEDLDPPATVYLDAEDGKPLFVAAGIGGDSFGTFRRRKSGSLKRVCSKHLAMVDSRGEAQRDLDKWAGKRKLAVAPEDSK